jgi:hypothetical protein
VEARKPCRLPAIPQYAYQEEDTLKLDMDDTAGINQASRGQMPSAKSLQSACSCSLSKMTRALVLRLNSHEHSYADLGRILLKFVGEYYETDRLLKIAGENKEYLPSESLKARTLETISTCTSSEARLCPAQRS